MVGSLGRIAPVRHDARPFDFGWSNVVVQLQLDGLVKAVSRVAIVARRCFDFLYRI